MTFSRIRLLITAAISAVAARGEVAYTPPIGVEVITIDGGTASAPVTTPLALTLSDRPAASGQTSGTIAAVDGSTLTVSGAGWTDSALAQPEFPYDMLLVSGSGSGARLAVTANTADTVTVTGRDLAALGVSAGDAYQLLPVDTLDTLFGSDTFQGGEDPASADVIAIGEQARVSYFYSTANSQWQSTDGSTTNAGNTRLPPNGMIAVVRKSGSFAMTLVGAVPVTPTNTPVANTGNTYTHTGFPVTISLGDLALQDHLAGWVADTNLLAVDFLQVAAGASWVTYFHNGTHWQRTPGDTTNRDNVVIQAGTPIRIIRQSGAAGDTPLVLPLPYTL